MKTYRYFYQSVAFSALTTAMIFCLFLSHKETTFDLLPIIFPINSLIGYANLFFDLLTFFFTFLYLTRSPSQLNTKVLFATATIPFLWGLLFSLYITASHLKGFGDFIESVGMLASIRGSISHAAVGIAKGLQPLISGVFFTMCCFILAVIFEYRKTKCEQSVPGYPPQGVGSPEP